MVSKGKKYNFFAWIPICKRPQEMLLSGSFYTGYRVKDKGISDLFNGATSTVFHFHHLSPCYGDKNKKLMRVISDDKSIRCNDNIDMNMIKIKCLVLRID